METYTEGIQASANTKRQHIIKEEQGKMSWIWIMIMTLKKNGENKLRHFNVADAWLMQTTSAIII